MDKHKKLGKKDCFFSHFPEGHHRLPWADLRGCWLHSGSSHTSDEESLNGRASQWALKQRPGCPRTSACKTCGMEIVVFPKSRVRRCLLRNRETWWMLSNGAALHHHPAWRTLPLNMPLDSRTCYSSDGNEPPWEVGETESRILNPNTLSYKNQIQEIHAVVLYFILLPVFILNPFEAS